MTVLLVAATLTLFPGEKLEYDVRYGPLRLGSLVLRTLASESLAGTECWHLAAELTLSHSVSWLFTARYDIQSWCRTSDFVTLRSYKFTRETNFADEWQAEYQPDSGKVTYSDGRTYRLLPQGRDLLTLWYFLRVSELRPGSVRVVNGHVDRRNYRVRVAVSSRRAVRVPAGAFDCLAVVPSADGPLGSVYLADDELRLPVVIKTKVGSLVVSAFLREVGTEEWE